MIVLRCYAISNTDPVRRTWRYEIQRCEQPWYRVAAHKLFHKFIEEPLDKPAQWLSKKVDQIYPGYFDWEENKLPYDLYLELRCYDLGEKGLRVIDKLPVNEATYNEASKYELA